MNQIISNQMIFPGISTISSTENSKIIDGTNQRNLIKRIAFHVAGLATAIYFSNKGGNYSSLFFQIMLNDLISKSGQDLISYQTRQYEDITRRLSGLLPPSVEIPMNNKSSTETLEALMDDAKIAYEMSIVSLLVGPLTEAKHVADTDNEVFNQHLVNLSALKNYRGSSNLALIHEYLQKLSDCKQQQKKKLDALFAIAFKFINDRSNWAAITKVANYIIDSNKNVIGYEEVVLLLEH